MVLQVGGEIPGLLAGVLPQQGLLGEKQGLGFVLLEAMAPLVEGGAVVDAFRHQGVEDVVHHLFVHLQTGVAGALGQVFDLVKQAFVVLEEGGAAVPIPLDQGGTDEDLPAELGVQGAIVDLAPIHHRQAVEGGAHGGSDVGWLLGPVGITVAHLEQVPRLVLDPFGFDFCNGPGVDPAGLHDLGRHEPLGLLLHAGPGEGQKLHVPGSQVDAIFGEHAQVAQQAGHEGLVQGGVIRLQPPVR